VNHWGLPDNGTISAWKVLFRSGGYVMAILVVETLILVGVVTLAMAWLGHPVD